MQIKRKGHGRVRDPKTDKRKQRRVYFSSDEYDELYRAAARKYQGQITAGITVNDLLNAFCLDAARKLNETVIGEENHV